MKCCICNCDIEGYGNSPYPVIENPGLRCCDSCNFRVVIPARIKLSKGEKDKGEKDNVS